MSRKQAIGTNPADETRHVVRRMISIQKPPVSEEKPKKGNKSIMTKPEGTRKKRAKDTPVARLVLFVDPKVDQEVRQLAFNQGRSISNLVEEILREGVAKRK